jgi:hypothetical protein
LLYGGHADRLCLGFIGTSKFCLREGESCGVLSHSKKFEVDHSQLYLKENENRAFIKPSFAADHLDASSLDLVLAKRRTLKEITELLDSLKRAEVASPCDPAPFAKVRKVPAELSTDSMSLAIQASFDLDLPKFITNEAGIFSAVPTLSFDVDFDEAAEDPFASLATSSSADIVAILTDFQERFVNLKTKWTQTFLEVDTSHSIVVKDLRTICERMNKVKTQLKALSDAAVSRENQLSTQISILAAELHHLDGTVSTSSAQVQSLQHEYSSLTATFQSNQEEQELQLQSLQSSVANLES